MATPSIRPETTEEKLVYWSIVLTWAFWCIGGLYVIAPVLGWSLFAISVGRHLGIFDVPPDFRDGVPWDTIVWAVSMLVMLITLIAGHINFDLGTTALLKSTIGWSKGWALLAVFIAVGSTMRIRPAVIFRASTILSMQTLAMTPVFILAFLAGLPRTLYVSPLQFVGGPGPEFFRVALFIVGGEGDAGGVRFGYYAPWAPAAALVAAVAFILALFDKDRRWKTVAMISAAVVCLLSQSRMSLVSIPATCALIVALSNLTRPRIWFSVLVVLLLAIPFTQQIQSTVEDSVARFDSARAASSRVRHTLQTIAIHRWQTEAPIFGHGVVEKGPHLVEYMPIGSHHSWIGLLYVKGIVGVLALAVPFVLSIVLTAFKAQSDRAARAALGILLTLSIFSFGENLEALSYLYWPGLVLIGISSRRRFVSPFRAPLSGSASQA